MSEEGPVESYAPTDSTYSGIAFDRKRVAGRIASNPALKGQLAH